MKNYIIISIACILSACGVSTTEYDKVVAERDSLANIVYNLTGGAKNQPLQTTQASIWEIKEYSDIFGDTSDGKYIMSERIHGTFSNSTTNHSSLGVRFIITKPEDINIMLFEYDGDNPVKTNAKYIVYVKDESGKTVEFEAVHSRSELSFGWNIEELYRMMESEGQLKFAIYKTRSNGTEYHFEVDTKGFVEAMELLTQSQTPKEGNTLWYQKQKIK
ncbi:hypothetical protein [Dysgonomonas sp. HGC4]|uniref:hypothetical protein n=1 Tax=Dysgonomonas sp. HGC4 TaxID=1658009 RepID=UPI0006805889|nr:hypothetical protein [Dysgonomonas sp. HGC4]MBD8347816.1 hypothetical protein [Dysgonomonas sp. HGC4]